MSILYFQNLMYLSLQVAVVRKKCSKSLYRYISLSIKFTNKDFLRGNRICLYSTLTEKQTIISGSAVSEAHKSVVMIDNQLGLSAEEECSSSERKIRLIQLVCCLLWSADDLTCKRKLGWGSHCLLDLHQMLSYSNIIRKDYDMMCWFWLR